MSIFLFLAISRAALVFSMMCASASRLGVSWASLPPSVAMSFCQCNSKSAVLAKLNFVAELFAVIGMCLLCYLLIIINQNRQHNDMNCALPIVIGMIFFDTIFPICPFRRRDTSC